MSLPEEILIDIFSYLEWDDILNARVVCKLWWYVGIDDKLFDNYFGCHIPPERRIFHVCLHPDNYGLTFCKDVINRSEDINKEFDFWLNRHRSSGNTPLMIACCSSHKLSVKIIKLLISKGADINTYNNFGLSPLIVMAYEGKKEKYDLLVSHGAELDLSKIENWRLREYIKKLIKRFFKE